MTRQIVAQKTIGHCIRELRERQGWSQEHLGDLCSIHRSHMGAIERGETNLTLSSPLIVILLALPPQIGEFYGVRLTSFGIFPSIKDKITLGSSKAASGFCLRSRRILARQRSPKFRVSSVKTSRADIPAATLSS